MNGLTQTGLTLTILSVGAVLLGVWYLNQHPYAQVSTFFTGRSDPLYGLAQVGVVGGILLFLVGLIVLIVGLVQRGGRR